MEWEHVAAVPQHSLFYREENSCHRTASVQMKVKKAGQLFPLWSHWVHRCISRWLRWKKANCRGRQKEKGNASHILDGTSNVQGDSFLGLDPALVPSYAMLQSGEDNLSLCYHHLRRDENTNVKNYTNGTRNMLVVIEQTHNKSCLKTKWRY